MYGGQFALKNNTCSDHIGYSLLHSKGMIIQDSSTSHVFKCLTMYIWKCVFWCSKPPQKAHKHTTRLSIQFLFIYYVK